jgi:hypothetical protein
MMQSLMRVGKQDIRQWMYLRKQVSLNNKPLCCLSIG